VTTTAPRPHSTSRPSDFDDFDDDEAPSPATSAATSPAPAAVSTPSRRAAIWVDSIFYTAVSVFVASLVAYFLLD